MDDYIQPNSTNTAINTLTPQPNKSVDINQQVASFVPISLTEMDSVKLMNRIDTKFLIGVQHLNILLERALEHYRIVEIDGTRIIPYSTIYFDTVDTIMYMMHHNRKLNRYKIRMRSYVMSGVSFLEIKRKNNKGRTTKKRIPIENEQFNLMLLKENEQEFVLKKTPYHPTLLKPQLQNSFNRITLVDKNLTERVTLDTTLIYKNLLNGLHKELNGLVIVEMKQDGACQSHFRTYLNELSVLPKSMSKYCLGMVLVNPEIKSNRFKNKIRVINKITANNHATN